MRANQVDPAQWKHPGQAPSTCGFCGEGYDPLFHSSSCLFLRTCAPFVGSEKDRQSHRFHWGHLPPLCGGWNSFTHRHTDLRILEISWQQVKGGLAEVLINCPFKIKAMGRFNYWSFYANQIQCCHKPYLSIHPKSCSLFSVSKSKARSVHL